MKLEGRLDLSNLLMMNSSKTQNLNVYSLSDPSAEQDISGLW